MRRGGGEGKERKPVGWIDFRLSEEASNSGFSNSFNVRNMFIEEMRRHVLGNRLSFIQQHRIVHQIKAEEPNCCNQTIVVNKKENEGVD